MKKIIVLSLSVVFIDCSSTRVLLHSDGVKADIYLMDRVIKNAELISYNDNHLVCVSEKLEEIPKENIQGLHLNIDRHTEWVLPFVLFQGIPTGILLALPSGDTREAIEFGALGLGALLLDFYLFSSSAPQVTFIQPWSAPEFEKIRAYTRYPGGLSKEQIKNLKWYVEFGSH